MNAPAKKTLTPGTVIGIVVIGIVAALAGALLAQQFLPKAPLALASGTVLQPAKPLPDFALVDQDARPFTPQELRNRWTVMFFGFTNCPDVCPTTLTLLAQVDKTLADLPAEQKPRVAFVTADAQRDTPEQVKKYAQFFSPAFIGITGTQAALETFALSLGAPTAIRPLENGSYTVDHSAAIFVIDPQGALRAVFGGPHRVDTLSADLRTLVGA